MDSQDERLLCVTILLADKIYSVLTNSETRRSWFCLDRGRWPPSCDTNSLNSGYRSS